MARRQMTKSRRKAAVTAHPPVSAKKVDAREVRRLVSSVPAGTRLRFTYKPQYPQVTGYLAGLIGAGVVAVDSPMVQALAHIICVSEDWSDDRNRTFEVVTTDKFDVEWFVARVGSDVESFEVVN